SQRSRRRCRQRHPQRRRLQPSPHSRLAEDHFARHPTRATPDLHNSASPQTGFLTGDHVLHASTDRDFDPVFTTMVQFRADMLVIGADRYFFGHRDQIAAWAIRHRMPAIFFLREFATVGGLMSYGPIVTESYHQVGIYAGRTLKGEKSADLPVIQSTKFQLVINVRTAKAVGLEVPPTLLVRADEVIE